MKRLGLALALCFLSFSAEAAGRFWVPLVVSGAVSGTGALCRLTVGDTSNLTAGDAVIVANIVGATACNGTTTVTTVVNATTVEVNIAFGVAYVSGGTVAGGEWKASNTANWASSSGGAPGQTAPGSADDVTFDGSSGGGTVVVNNASIDIKSLTLGAFTGTFTNATNNNAFTIEATYSNTGSATRTVNLGAATWTIKGTGTVWDQTVTTNLTFSAASSTLVFTATTASLRSMVMGNSKTYGTITVSANTGLGFFQFGTFTGTSTITTFNVTGPNFIEWAWGSTTAVTNAMNIVGTASAPIMMTSGLPTSQQATISSAVANTWVGCMVWDINFTGGGSLTATNSTNLGNNAGVTITAPSGFGGGGSSIVGG